MHARGLRRINIFFWGGSGRGRASLGEKGLTITLQNRIYYCVLRVVLLIREKNDVLEGPESFLNIGKLIFSSNGFQTKSARGES